MPVLDYRGWGRRGAPVVKRCGGKVFGIFCTMATSDLGVEVGVWV